MPRAVIIGGLQPDVIEARFYSRHVTRRTTKRLRCETSFWGVQDARLREGR
jgi:hypothetical protein